MSSALESCPALVLNADFRPLNYFPLSLWSWQDAVKAVFLDRVNVVSEYDQAIHSPSWQIQLPSVISLKEYVQVSRRPAFTRFNVFLRDRFTCQYCNAPFQTPDLTFDHVIPRSKGGRTEWTNVVTACSKCNLRKGNMSVREAGMIIHRKPVQPNNYLLQEIGRGFPPNYLHESWRDFLYWDSELEDD
ncbi:MAG: HNH endonuclease [Rhodospirillaceae bacterium]|jgi:5-methylcytosine-specific restriction endonuclease McrA